MDTKTIKLSRVIRRASSTADTSPDPKRFQGAAAAAAAWSKKHPNPCGWRKPRR